MFKRSPLIYLASPYTSKDKNTMLHRERVHCEVGSKLIKEGKHVYCPLAETSALAHHGDLTDTNWSYWRDHDLNILDRCSEIWIIMIDGTTISTGVRAELKHAVSLNLPVIYIHLNPKSEELYISKPTFEQLLKDFNIKHFEDLE